MPTGYIWFGSNYHSMVQLYCANAVLQIFFNVKLMHFDGLALGRGSTWNLISFIPCHAFKVL